MERGVQRAARELGLPVRGFCTSNERDEYGTLPPGVRDGLTPCSVRGARAAAIATIAIANAVLILVPDVSRFGTLPGMSEIQRRINRLNLPLAIADPTSSLDRIGDWVRGQWSKHPNIFITGPRATRWAEGEHFARRLLVTMHVADTGIVPNGVAHMSAVRRGE